MKRPNKNLRLALLGLPVLIGLLALGYWNIRPETFLARTANTSSASVFVMMVAPTVTATGSDEAAAQGASRWAGGIDDATRHALVFAHWPPRLAL